MFILSTATPTALLLSDSAPTITSVLALCISAFTLFWQRSLVDRQLKHQLYQKRFDCQQVLLRCLGLKVLTPITPLLRRSNSALTREEQFDIMCEDFGFYSTKQITDLFVALYHINNLYDSETIQIAQRLADAAQKYRLRMEEIVSDSGTFSGPNQDQLRLLNDYRSRVNNLADSLIPRLDASLKLYQDPWWIRLRHHIDCWEETVTNNTPDTESPPPAN